MPREKKDARNFNIRIATQTYKELERFCEETGMTKTTATEKILTQFFEEYFQRPEKERRIFK